MSITGVHGRHAWGRLGSDPPVVLTFSHWFSGDPAVFEMDQDEGRSDEVADSAGRLAALVRGEWAIENRDHYVRGREAR